jgi:very-short-patch-repair endonuclease
MPVFQFEVWHNGKLIARLDFAFPRYKIAIEIDGWSSRATSADLRRSTRRRNALTALGWTILHFTWLDIVGNPDYVVSQIAAELPAVGA